MSSVLTMKKLVSTQAKAATAIQVAALSFQPWVARACTLLTLAALALITALAALALWRR